ncbi:hypothetical protein OUZ56_006984 [Daphnia magna]|uniref:LITAF domain-containing protein n=1 Tax=Daphnia magna TaxID=35525 RepID=A0ABQ9YX99_9CRUS|nr:hypothetical protein OUZ56_006984 [Daphnia magna]
MKAQVQESRKDRKPLVSFQTGLQFSDAWNPEKKKTEITSPAASASGKHGRYKGSMNRTLTKKKFSNSIVFCFPMVLVGWTNSFVQCPFCGRTPSNCSGRNKFFVPFFFDNI